MQIELAELAEELPKTFRQSIELATCPESFLQLSGYVPESLQEAAAVHEIILVFHILVLLGRAVRTKEASSNICSRLKSLPVIFMKGATSARGSNLFAVGTGPEH